MNVLSDVATAIDTPLVLALSVSLLRDRVHPWVIAGAILAFIDVADRLS